MIEFRHCLLSIRALVSDVLDQVSHVVHGQLVVINELLDSSPLVVDLLLQLVLTHLVLVRHAGQLISRV